MGWVAADRANELYVLGFDPLNSANSVNWDTAVSYMFAPSTQRSGLGRITYASNHERKSLTAKDFSLAIVHALLPQASVGIFKQLGPHDFLDDRIHVSFGVVWNQPSVHTDPGSRRLTSVDTDKDEETFPNRCDLFSAD